MKNSLCILIPAAKKSVAFPDDLVKKLNGITLIQRCIEKAKLLDATIIVATDSQEISLIAERSGVYVYFDALARFDNGYNLEVIFQHLSERGIKWSEIMILSPYAPLLSVSLLKNIHTIFTASNCNLGISVKNEKRKIFHPNENHQDIFNYKATTKEHLVELNAFKLAKKELFEQKSGEPKIHPFLLDDDYIEINSYHDFWACEKIMKRRRIVFSVIGNDKLGLGHVYRSLALAHEMTEHEIIFVCNVEHIQAISKIAGSEYLVVKYSENEELKTLLELKPALVVFDVLDTHETKVKSLVDAGIKVVSFEDFGDGVQHTNLSFNELFDEPLIEAPNIRWGKKYFFVRDEFEGAKKNRFKQNVEKALVTFGGSDPSNYTLKTIEAIKDYCFEKDIVLQIVTGSAYLHNETLKDFCSKHPKIEWYSGVGMMSKVMEGSQVAVASNGRTAYELAHMNIPSIVLSHHERELTHRFTTEKNGFLHLGIWEKLNDKSILLDSFIKLCEDVNFRKSLFDKAKKVDFIKNKKKVTSMILKLLEGNQN